jgi:Leucine-rich repeat (LRR) protein
VSTLFIYAERELDWRSLHRLRPDAGLAFEKHVWSLPMQTGTLPARDIPFEYLDGVATRARTITRDDGTLVPVLDRVDTTALPVLSRVAMAGPGMIDLLAEMTGDGPAVLDAVGVASLGRFTDTSAPEQRSLSLARISSPQEARAAAELIASTSGVHLLGAPRPGPGTQVPGWPLSMPHVLDLHHLRAGSMEYVRFAALVGQTDWFATCVRTDRWAIEGVVLYAMADRNLLARVAAAAQRTGVALTHIGVDEAATLRPSSIASALPSFDMLPIGADTTIDASGFNVAALPTRIVVSDLRIDDTAVTDMTPLTGASTLQRASIRRLRPRSLAPLRGITHLVAGPLRAHDLVELGGFEQLEVLRIEHTRLRDLAPLSRCQRLQRLELHHVDLTALDGIHELFGLEELVLHVPLIDVDLAPLTRIPRLRALSIHCRDSFDVELLPDLPALQELEICGLDGRALALSNAHSLARFGSLTRLCLATTDVGSIEWIGALQALTALDLHITRIADAAPLRVLRALRSLDLRGAPITSLAVVATLPFEVLRAPAASDISAVLHALTDPASLRVLDVHAPDETTLAALGPFSSFLRLEELVIDGSAIADLSVLTELRKLRRLSARHCPVDDLGPLGECRELLELDLSYRPSGPLDGLERCTNLRTLHITDLAAPSLSPLRTLEKLESLDLRSAHVGDADALGELASLQRLRMDESSISTFEPLTRLPRLRALEATHRTSPPDPAPLLSVPPLARLVLSRSSQIWPVLGALHVRHNLTLVGD